MTMMMMVRTVWCLLFLVLLIVMCNPRSGFCYHMAWGPIYNSFDRKYEDLHPQDVMVDYINRVGLYLLDVHNEDNLHNNIALSPYGAVSVLIALAEGLRGDAALEIYRASHIPHDLTIIRIGLRDIHKHLKSYFIPREGFLAGLTLSHENVTLSPSYERILRFYGYDLESFNGVRIPSPSLPSIAPPPPPAEVITTRQPPEARTEPRTTTTATPQASSTVKVTTDEEVVTIPTQPSSTTIKVTTTEEVVTIPVVEVTTAIAEATTSRVVVAAAEETTTTTENVVTIPVVEVTTKTPETTMKVIMDAAETTTTAGVVSEEVGTTMEVATVEVESSSSVAAATTESEAELIAITTAIPETTTTTATLPQEILEAVRTMSSANLASRSNVTGKIEMITAINIQTQTKISPAVVDVEMDGNTKRNQRSIIDYLIARYYDDYYIPKKYNFPKFRPRIPFFVDGIPRIDRAYFMTYDTILPFFYMPNLEALALSFPLDSTHYYLLLILPLREDGIDDLICDLKRNPDLKYIIRNMKYTHVKAIIPSFTLRGHVNLTPSLQRLGIEKIFQPHHADFTPMTNNKDVYVTNIEQAITVKIRNYVDLEVASDHAGNLHRYPPVEFKADHPFLYFVMDSQMHVALMAGKIIDPLSSRIR